MEIIPAVDIKRGYCVRLRRGDPKEEIIYSRDPLAMAKRWAREGARRIHIVDLDGAFIGRPVNIDLIARLAQNISIPVQVGGGIRTLRDIKCYLDRGVEKVVLGTRLLEDKRFIQDIKKVISRVLVALDIKNSRIAIKGWQEVSPIKALSWISEIDKMGAAGLIYTDISRDGMLSGPNLRFMRRLLAEVRMPLYVSGGISNPEDIKQIKRLGQDKIKGIIIGQALYSRKIKLSEAMACVRD